MTHNVKPVQMGNQWWFLRPDLNWQGPYDDEESAREARGGQCDQDDCNCR